VQPPAYLKNSTHFPVRIIRHKILELSSTTVIGKFLILINLGYRSGTANRLMEFNFTNFQNKISGFVLKKDNAALSVIFISPDAWTVLACRS
jgi:hypothetical protein